MQFEEQNDKILINNKEIQIVHRFINHVELKYDVHNPRVFSNWNAKEHESLDQKTVEEKMQQMEHVKVLKENIKSNGGVIEPLYVRDEDFVVFDGNSRLAAFRLLSKIDPIRWVNINCVILPPTISDSEIYDLLGTLHIVGRKDWQPFEQAGYLFRRLEKEDIDSEEIAKRLGITKSAVNDMIQTYRYMIEKGDAESSKYSYYFELLKNRGFREICKINPKFESAIVTQIKGNGIERAEDIREITKIAKIKPRQLKNHIQEFISGEMSFTDLIEEAINSGADNTSLQKFETFRKVSSDYDKIEKDYNNMADAQKKQFKYGLERISKNLKHLVERFTDK